jgi:hypothetical protein
MIPCVPLEYYLAQRAYDPAVAGARYKEELARLESLPKREQHRLRRRWRTNLVGIALALVLGVKLAAPLPVRAAAITVDAGGVCTLAEAITSANDDSAGLNGCVDGSGADTITLGADITLTDALPTISSDITIEGGGHTIERPSVATTEFRILDVDASGVLTLNQATISGGWEHYYSPGGAIRNVDGTVTVQDSTLSGNYAYYGGGIWSSGVLTVTTSTISGNSTYYGGGIWSSGVLAVITSTISGNTSNGHGGGIYVSGSSATGTVQDSTLSGNSANSSGGGILNTHGSAVMVNRSTISGNSANWGGGIRTDGTSTMTVTTSTISGNSADWGGGLYVRASSTATVNSSTIVSNTVTNGGGGIRSIMGSTVQVQNSIVASHSGMGDCSDDGDGTITSAGYNIESAETCGFTGTDDEQNTDPLLQALADNGGATWTHALGSGSVAIDDIPDGTNGCSSASVDQRGGLRIEVTGEGTETCDIGAYEFGADVPTAVTLTRFGDGLGVVPSLVAGGVAAALAGLGGGVFKRRRRART